MDKNLESEKMDKNSEEQVVNEDVKNVEATEVSNEVVADADRQDNTPEEAVIEQVQSETVPSVEETVEEEVAVESEPEEEEKSESSDALDYSSLGKAEIIEKLKNLRMQEEVPSRQQVDALRHAFYNIRKAEIDEERGKFDEHAEEGEEFVASVDPLEDVLKVYLSDIKEKRAKKVAEENIEKENNYKIKLEIIASIKALSESTDDFNKLFQEFKDLQQKWNEIKLVPQNKTRELWTEYQIYSEKFYDLVKINNELRDYDFKKNLELKTDLCELAERLVKEEVDPVSAFHQLQNFHQQWREIGPVERNQREEIWNRFKEVSSVINRNYQSHFESLKEQEEGNLQAKKAIIDELKTIDYATLNAYKDWDAKTKEVIALQAKWRTIGFVPRKVNNEIFEEFRALCDTFFEQKSQFFKGQRKDQEDNLAKKRALTDRALELKDSTDWDKTMRELIQIQKDWKKIGPVPRKFSDAIWKEFVGACDAFFERRKAKFSTQKEQEVANYKAKKAIVEQINELDKSLDTHELVSELKRLQDEWHKIGFVPYKDKDKSYKELYAAVDAHYDRLKIDKDERRFEEFKSNMEGQMANKDNAERALSKERNHLTYQYNKLKSDLQTYQNNMSFLTLSSKGKDNPLLKDVIKKIESLKSEMELIEKKVEALDENLKDLD